MLRLCCDGKQWEKAKDNDDGDWGHFHETPRSHSPDKISSQFIYAARPSQAHSLNAKVQFLLRHEGIEGREVCDWLNSIGISYILLKVWGWAFVNIVDRHTFASRCIFPILDV